MLAEVLLLHVPKFNNYYKPIGPFSFVNLPPMGLLGLADCLAKNDCSTRIIHLGVEREMYGTIDFEKIIADHRPSIIGLDLHWHFQSFDVIEVARKIKGSHPDIAILLGGFTASFFAEEILQSFDCIDFVIQGDAEIPLLSLVRQYRSGHAYDQVPNLVFRSEHGIQVNPTSYVADCSILDRTCYTDFTLMKDYPTFINSFSKYMDVDELSQYSQKALLGWKKSYPVFLGRGCPHRCSYCGGSIDAQKLINNRPHTAMRSIATVMESIRDLQRFGFDFAYLAFDSLPPAKAEEFYLPLFSAIKREHIQLDFEVDRYFLPTPRFIESFRHCLGSNSFITISPNSHSEDIRKKNGLYRYSNAELEKSLEVMDAEGVNCALFFACGLPFESEADLKALAQYQKELKKKFKRVQCKTGIIEIEPASEMSRNPEAYGITPHRQTFMEYYRYHSQPSQNHFLEMGYDRAGYPGSEQVVQFYCNNFCSHFRTGRIPPRLCKAFCSTSSVMQKLGMFKLLNSITKLGQTEASDSAD